MQCLQADLAAGVRHGWHAPVRAVCGTLRGQGGSRMLRSCSRTHAARYGGCLAARRFSPCRGVGPRHRRDRPIHNGRARVPVRVRQRVRPCDCEESCQAGRTRPGGCCGAGKERACARARARGRWRALLPRHAGCRVDGSDDPAALHRVTVTGSAVDSKSPSCKATSAAGRKRELGRMSPILGLAQPHLLRHASPNLSAGLRVRWRLITSSGESPECKQTVVSTLGRTRLQKVVLLYKEILG